MAYGLVGDNVDTFGPTIQGMKLLRQAVLGGNYPQLRAFVNIGESNNPQELAMECVELSKSVNEENLKSTLVNLGLAASRCKEKLSLC